MPEIKLLQRQLKNELKTVSIILLRAQLPNHIRSSNLNERKPSVNPNKNKAQTTQVGFTDKGINDDPRRSAGEETRALRVVHEIFYELFSF